MKSVPCNIILPHKFSTIPFNSSIGLDTRNYGNIHGFWRAKNCLLQIIFKINSKFQVPPPLQQTPPWPWSLGHLIQARGGRSRRHLCMLILLSARNQRRLSFSNSKMASSAKTSSTGSALAPRVRVVHLGKKVLSDFISVFLMHLATSSYCYLIIVNKVQLKFARKGVKELLAYHQAF